jgi:hypothetical protein
MSRGSAGLVPPTLAFGAASCRPSASVGGNTQPGPRPSAEC